MVIRFLLHCLAKIAFFILLIPPGGAVLILLQCLEGIPQHANQEPQAMSCRQLIDQGVKEKAHIVLTDYRLEAERIVVVPSSLGEDWRKAWVPACPVDSAKTRSPIRVLVETDRVKTVAALDRLQDANRIQGVVVVGIGSLPIGKRIALQRENPNTDFGACFLLQHGKSPPHPAATYGLIALGVLMVLSGFPIYYVAWQLIRSES